MNKLTATSLGFAALFALNGCGSDSMDTRTISGKAIDPYLAGATVCLGDDDRHCLGDEASVTTDDQGNYTLTVSGTHFQERHTIVVTGGHDVATKANFTGSIVAYHYDGNATVNVSPLTTLAYAEFQEANATTDATRRAIEANLTKFFNCDVHADVVAEANTSHNYHGIRAAVKLANCAALYDNNDTFGFYVHVAHAHHHGDADVNVAIQDGAAKAEASGHAKNGFRAAVNDVVDTVDAADNTVHDIANDAHDFVHSFFNTHTHWFNH